MTTRIINKVRMYQHLRAGAFGNTVQQWSSLEDFLRAGPHTGGLFSIRSRQVGGRCDYQVPAVEVPLRCKNWPGEFNINPTMPDEKISIQGEVCLQPDLRLFYSTAPKAMRRALAESGINCHGIVAKSVLCHYVDPSSYQDILTLLEYYPDHVVEFGAYRMGVGADPRRNTVIWEVRLY